MSYCFDQMARWFRDRFEPKSGDVQEKYLFSMIIEEMHGANHMLPSGDGRFSGDGLNKSQRVTRAVRDLEEYLESKEGENG